MLRQQVQRREQIISELENKIKDEEIVKQEIYKSMEKHMLSNKDRVSKEQWEKQMVEEDLQEKIKL